MGQLILAAFIRVHQRPIVVSEKYRPKAAHPYWPLMSTDKKHVPQLAQLHRRSPPFGLLLTHSEVADATQCNRKSKKDGSSCMPIVIPPLTAVPAILASSENYETGDWTHKRSHGTHGTMKLNGLTSLALTGRKTPGELLDHHVPPFSSPYPDPQPERASLADLTFSPPPGNLNSLNQRSGDVCQ